MCCTTHLSGALLWEQSALFHGFFSQHDWLSDYFHFCLCWQRWQKDYIPVEGKGGVRPSDKLGSLSIRSPTLEYCCVAGPVFMGRVSAPVLRPQPCGRSGWSTRAPHRLRGRERDGQTSPFHVCSLNYQGPAQTNHFSFENKPHSEPRAPLRTYFCFSKRSCAVVLECVSADMGSAVMILITQLFGKGNLGGAEIYTTRVLICIDFFMATCRNYVEKIRNEDTHFLILCPCCLSVYEKRRQRKINSQSLGSSLPVVLMVLFLKCALCWVSLNWCSAEISHTTSCSLLGFTSAIFSEHNSVEGQCRKKTAVLQRLNRNFVYDYEQTTWQM